MRKPLHKEVADKIRGSMNEDASYFPPSIAHVMTRHRVSATTACKAVRVLVDEGLLLSKRGSGITKATGGGANPRDRLFADVKTLIQDGVWRPGDRVPKFDYLAAKHAVSRTTVFLAVDRLARELLIHKRGKFWIVGPRPSAHSRGAAAAATHPSAVALALCTGISERTHSNFFVLPFVETLGAELRESGLDLLYGYRTKDPLFDTALVPYQGLAAVRGNIRDWGERFRGTVILDRWMDAELLEEWYDTFSVSGTRPVIFFDHAGDHQSLTRTELRFGDTYYFMHLDEDGAVRLALERLIDMGHEIVGLPTPSWPKSEWVARRTGLVRKVAAGYSRLREIVTAPLAEEFFGAAGTDDPQPCDSLRFTELVNKWARARTPARDIRGVDTRVSPEVLIRGTDSLTSIISRGATAFLCLNDHIAQLCYLWCNSAGIGIPRDLSLISFDNSREYQFTPLSTIDFGFSRLGTLAGRILRGAESLPVDRSGSIPGICTLVNRGSLGTPNPAAGGTARRVQALKAG